MPLSFDFPGADVQEVCLKSYDQEKAGGALADHQFHRRNALGPYGSAENQAVPGHTHGDRAFGGWRCQAEQDRGGDRRHGQRAATRLVSEHGLKISDVFVDISVSALIADTTGMTRATLDGIRAVAADPDLKGINISGGLSNIGQQLPPKAADGSDLKEQLECAFLTLAVPYGMNTVLGTPWRNYQSLPEDNFVLDTFRNFIDLSGSSALRQVRKFYRS